MAMQFGNGIDLAGQRGINAGDPSTGTDLANKQYVDALVRGLSWKASVRAASTADVTVSSAPSTLDGVTLAGGDRVLLKNQTAASENGIYVFTAAASALTRATDADTASELIGATVTVTEGSTLADKVYRLLTDNVTLGTTSLSWTEVGGSSASYTAGDGLAESPAGTFNVNTGTGLEVSSDTVRIATSAAGAGLTGGGGSALAIASSSAGAGLTLTAGVFDVVGDASITVSANSLGLASGVAGSALTLTSGVLDVAAGTGLEVSSDALRIAAAAAGNGLTGGGGSALAVNTGTGLTITADAVQVDSTVVRQYAAAIGDGSTTNIVVTHGLGTRDVDVTVRNASSPYEEVIVDNEATSTTTVTLRFATAPTSSQYRVTVQGAA
ncbi:hypothetical protein ACWD2L_05890 [Streptomyces sp. NPDC002754]